MDTFGNDSESVVGQWPVLTGVERRWVVGLGLLSAVALLASSVAQGAGSPPQSASIASGAAGSWMVLSGVLLGLGLSVLQRGRDSSWVRPVVFTCASLGLLSGLLAGSGIPGLPIWGAGGPTLRLFLVAMSGGLGVLALPPTQRRVWRIPMVSLMSLLVLLQGIEMLGRQAGLEFLPGYGSATSPGSALALSLLGLAFLIASGARECLDRALSGQSHPVGESDASPKPGHRSEAVILFLLVAGLLAATGFAYLRLHVVRMREDVASQLSSVADLKVSQLGSWRRERLGDAQILARAPLTLNALRGLADRKALDAFLEEYRRTYHYSAVLVLDRHQKPVVLSPSTLDPARVLSNAQGRGMDPAPGMAVDRLNLDPNGRPALDFLANILSVEGQVIGSVLLRVDPRTDLFPMIGHWPVPSSSAESLILRSEGPWVQVLSELRFRSNAPMNLRLPLDKGGIEAGWASARAGVGLLKGLDYRGVPALGVARRVEGTPWVMLAKMDEAEADDALRSEVWRVVALLCLALVSAGLAMGYYWRGRNREFARRVVEQELEKRSAVDRLALVMRSANDAILVFDDRKRIVEANERAVDFYGCTASELLQLTVDDLRTEEVRGTSGQDFGLALSSGGHVFQTWHRRKDGTIFPVEVSARRLDIGGRPHVLSVIRDITDRKAQEQEFEGLNRVYYVNSLINQAMVRARSREELFEETCRILVETGRFKIAWIGWLRLETRLIEPVAVAGDEHGYVKGIRISEDESVPEGRGPSGVAFRAGESYVCNDFFADPGTVPWRERALQSGFKSTMAVPLSCEGVIRGLIVVYAAEPGFFNARKIQLLERTAGDLSYALNVFAGEARRREAEAAVRASESRLQFLLTASSAIIYSLRVSGDFGTTFISPNVRQVLGYEPLMFTSDPGFWLRGVHPEDLPGAIAATSTLKASDAVSREYRFRHADGSWRWMRDEIRLAQDTPDRPKEWVGCWLDITGRRETEDALKAREEIFRSIVVQAVDGIALVDAATGRFLEFNPSAHEALGYTREVFAGLTIADIQAEHSPEQIRENIARIVNQGSATFESLHRHRDGRVLNVRISARLVRLRNQDCITAMWGDITEAKRAELEFRKLSLAVEQNPTSIVITDLSGAIEYVNPRFTEVTGYTLEEVRGRNPRVVKSGDNPPGLYKELWGTITRGGIWRGELVNRKKNGEQHVESIVITPVRDPEGRPTHYVALKEDITERRRSEAQLRKLSRTIEQAPLSVAITSLDGAIEYVNPAFIAVTGYSLDEVLGLNPRVLKSGETPPERYVEMWSTLTRGEVWRGELTNKKKNGDLYVEAAVIAPVVDEYGKPTHYVALKEDITHRKRTEAALRETQERYRIIAENTGDVIWLYDLVKEHFIYCSPSVFRLRGVTPEEVLGQSVMDVLTPESADQIRRSLPTRLARFASGDPSVQTQVDSVQQYHRNGSVITVEVVTTLIADAQGRPAQVLGVTRDVTERKRALEALQESRDRLARAEHIARLGNWVLDLRSGQLIWSDEMFRLLELDPSTTTPTLAAWQARMDAGERADLEQRLHLAVVNRERMAFGSRLSLGDGRIKFLEGTGEVSCAPDGTPLRVVGTLQDVTAQRQVEFELNEMVAGLRAHHAISKAIERRDLSRIDLMRTAVQELCSAVRHPTDACAILEIDGHREVAGTPGEFAASMTEPITINDRSAGHLTVGYVTLHDLEASRPFQERERGLLQNVASTISLGLGEREAFAAVQRFNLELESKVSQRTEELAARNREVQGLLDSIPDMVLRMHRSGALLKYQPAKGATPLPDPSWTAASGPGPDPAPGLLRAALDTGIRALAEATTLSTEVQLAGEGAGLTVELRVAPIGTDEFVVFVRDITARKHLEDETRAMLEKEREVSEMKTRFISVASHEFRTPMAAALGSVELLQHHSDRITAAKREELLGRISNSIDRMTGMLDEILILSRVDAGRMQKQLFPVLLHDYVRGVVDELRLADRTQHTFVLEVAGEDSNFPTDTNLLHHILSNLLSNAARYSPAGTTVTVRLQVDTAGARISIEDEGIGILESDRKRIFEPFERGSNVGRIKGTGLGLNIVKRMTGMLGGSVRVEPHEPKGSRFILELPRLEASGL